MIQIFLCVFFGRLTGREHDEANEEAGNERRFSLHHLYISQHKVPMKTKKKKLDDDLLKKALEEENLIRTAFKDKDWAEIKGANSWMIFKVMSEFVEGMEKLAKIGPCVTIFG